MNKMTFENAYRLMNINEAKKLRHMAEFGKQKAPHCSKQEDYPGAQRWEQWAYYKELEAEYYESQI